MPSVLIQTADAVTEELNNPTGHTWSLSFTAERSYADWDLALDDQSQRGTLLCDVVPVSSLPADLETRGSVIYSPSIDIAIRKKFEPADAETDTGKITLEAVDELVALVEEINEYFAVLRLPDYDTATWKQTAIQAAVIHKHLRENDKFTGIVRLTFDASIDL